MRVTNKMLSGSFLRDMRKNLSNMQKLQQQMTSGKEISKPSDDPFKVARSMQLHTDINSNKQFNENISDTINWLDTTDTALDQAGNVLQRMHELLISAGNAGYSENERRAIKDEINEKIGEFSQVMNTSFDGKYVFGGSRGTTKPLDVKGGVKYENAKVVKINNLDQWKDDGGKTKLTFSDGTTTSTISISDGIENVSDLADEINKNLDENLKLRAVPNIGENSIMFISKNTADITISKDGSEATYPTDLDVSAPIKTAVIKDSGNTELIYYKKGGGELLRETLVEIDTADINANWQNGQIELKLTEVNGTETNVTINLPADIDKNIDGSVDTDELIEVINDNINPPLQGKLLLSKVTKDGKEFVEFNSSSGNEIKITNTTVNNDDIVNMKDQIIGNIESKMISDKLKTEISQGVSMEYNVTASELLQFTTEKGETKDLRDMFKAIVNHLDGKNADGGEIDNSGVDSVKELTNSDLQNIKDALNNLLKVRAEVGAKQNRMESGKEKNEEENFNMMEILSKTEDIDITEKTMQYATMQTIYMASLQTSAKVLQPSLIDYLR